MCNVYVKTDFNVCCICFSILCVRKNTLTKAPPHPSQWKIEIIIDQLPG